ncbi:EAL domain-containing protein [Geodermatophilus sp. YIM 151500]|uniref:putative bifunctional diguanylate cyclase/phosphodiesterase n=1 Tax=Geodermatophilus sp. YIM 151500 TaxID=2984531 RepID=UPI0021E42A5A|nr:EAL domain-containing protein [Geodermatophilus sp. YIM 151500]MCV2488718.1 EAL domain-containing protein [Geodermatophilus sp. YIM 151500]
MEREDILLRPPGTDPVARAEALLALTDVLARATTDMPLLLRTAAEAVARLCGDTVAIWLVDTQDGPPVMQVRAWWHVDPLARTDLEELGAPVRLPSDPPGFLWSVAASGPRLMAHVRRDDLAGIHPGYGEYFRRWGLASMLLVPLRARNRLLGLMGVSRDADGPAYDEDDLAFAVRVAAHLSLALDNAGLVAEVRRELGERIAAERALRHQAQHDALTGLPNRLTMRTAVDDALAGGRVALLVADLDGFKEVNDALGHTVGDDALQQVARRLRAATPADGLLARLGGDEFAVVLPSADRGRGLDVAGALRATLATPVAVAASRLALSASVGVAVAPDDGTDAATLLRYADVAMYRAKRAATGVAAYDPDLDTAAAQRLPRLTELRRALVGGELLVHWQPIVESATGAVRHREALVRWAHPREGLLGADEVVPLAEQGGLAGELTEVVLRLALGQWRAWSDAGAALPVAVNVPPSVVGRESWVGDVLAELGAHGAPPASLVVEVTESALATDATRRGLTALAEAGVRLALDDFGTGWSSLAQMRTMPLHQLKADRTFVTGMADDRTDRALVRTVTALGHELGLEVVAEGVQTPEVRDLLTAMGVDLQQGFLHGRPAAAPADAPGRRRP